jgi:OFA family oxalate/formate antiporter-like MFS transporter
VRSRQPNTGLTVLIAALIVSAVFGSIHAFSVFLEPLELRFDEPRSAVSLTYSLALVALTSAVLFGPRFFGRWSAATFILFACVLAAFGTLLARMASSLSIVWIGYSLIFGAANGLGYGFGLQISAQVNPGREGLAMGIVTAAYAFGAVVSPGLFDLAVEARGFATAMMILTGVLLTAGVLSAALMWKVDAKFQTRQHRVVYTLVHQRSQQLL